MNDGLQGGGGHRVSRTTYCHQIEIGGKYELIYRQIIAIH